jgi:hypothetical protein
MARAGEDSGAFTAQYFHWLDLPLDGGSSLVVPEYLAPAADALTVLVAALYVEFGPRPLGRIFINRFSPAHRAGQPSQWLLRPHRDEGNLAVVLSLRPAGTNGGLLMASNRPNGEFLFRQDRRHTVDTRRGQVTTYCQVRPTEG